MALHEGHLIGVQSSTKIVVQFSVRDKLIETKESHGTKWGCSSVGRAPALQAGGHGFESHHLQSAKAG